MYNTRVFDYFYNCLRKACLYFSLPTSHQNLNNFYKERRHTTYTQKDKEREQRADNQSKNKMQTGSDKQTNEEKGTGLKNTKCLKDSALSSAVSDGKSSQAGSVHVEDKCDESLQHQKIKIDDLGEETAFSRLGSVDCLEEEDVFAVKDVPGVETEPSKICDDDGNSQTVEKKEETDGSCSDDIPIPENEFLQACKMGIVKDASDLEAEESANKDKDETSNIGVGVSHSSTADSLKDRAEDEGKRVDSCSDTGNGSAVVEQSEIKVPLPGSDAETPAGESCLAASAVVDSLLEKIDFEEESETHNLSGVESGSETESRNDGDETSDSSPTTRPRVSSPAGAEYTYKFSAETLTDGKVGLSLTDIFSTTKHKIRYSPVINIHVTFGKEVIFLQMGQGFRHQLPVLENVILHPPCKTSRVR